MTTDSQSPATPPGCRDLPDFPGYRITTRGVVYSSRSGRWRPLKPLPDREGHGLKIVLRCGYNPPVICRPMLARLVLETFTGPAPRGMVCMHKNDDPTDCRLDNLRWGTRYEALRRARRAKQGLFIPRFQDADIQAIRAAHHAGVGMIAQAKKYGVSRMAISYIVHHKNWKHLPGPTAQDEATTIHDH